MVLLIGDTWSCQNHEDRKQSDGRRRSEETGSCFMGTEFQFGKLRRFQWQLHDMVNMHNIAEGWVPSEKLK